MNKKILIIVMAMMIMIATIVGSIYLVNLSRIKNNKPILFSTESGNNNKQILEDSDRAKEYSLEQAIREGCFVITNDNKIYNKDKLDSFIENTGINSKNRIEDNLRIVQFTKEGDPIIQELSYKIKEETYVMSGKPINKTTYVLKTDNTRDRFASDEDRKTTINEDIPGDVYGIIEEKDGKMIKISLALYAIIDYVDENVKRYENIDICSYSSDAEMVQNEFFYGKVIETSQNHIMVEPNEGEKIRESADKISISLGESNDVIYQVGTNVKITYTGYIMETYPAKVDVVNIELKSAENFELRFYDKHPENDTKIHKILDKSETNQYHYNIYTYDGSVNILINGEEISLRNALLDNKITMNEIIEKANQDLATKKISGDMYKDGGSILYQYEEFSMIKFHTLDGNRDVYIGTRQMTINDIMYNK